MVITGTLRYSHPSDELGSLAAVTVDSGTANATYGASNLLDYTGEGVGQPALSNTTAAISFQLDFGSAKTVAAMLFWHNLDAGGVITIKANSSASWASPPYTTTVTALAKRGDSRTVKLVKFPAQTYRYWLVMLPAGNSVAPGLKLQVYSQARSLTGHGSGNTGKTYLWNAVRTNRQIGIDHATAFGFHWYYDLQVGAESFTGPIVVSDADALRLVAWHEATGGRALTLFVPDSNTTEAWLARISLGPTPMALSKGPFVSEMNQQYGAPNYTTITLTAEDMTAGGPEWS